MRIHTLLLSGTLALATLTACAPMQTYDRPAYGHRGYPAYSDHGEYAYPDRSDYVYPVRGDSAYPERGTYAVDRDYQPGPDYRVDDRRSGPGCDYCGTVRRITRVARGTPDNTGAIVVGALVGGALGNTVGSGDGRRAATVVGAVAGGAVANNMTRDQRRYDLYRIDVQFDNGDIYSFDQDDAAGMQAGSFVEVRNNLVYPLR
jgi:outer membrane lipoprotein SlyB